MVVTGHPLASQVGATVLERGGNAIDAAVAVGFALAVVLPEAGNLGGGGFLVYRTASDGSGAAAPVYALDYRERAPSAASRDMYLGPDGEPTDLSVTGHLAAGVPGSPAGLAEMHGRFGSLPWAELVQPAIDLARGHPLDQVRYDHLVGDAERLGRFAASREQFLPRDGAPVAAGATWQQPDLARTLERLRDGGAEEFYRGETARLLVAEMERGKGLITMQDLADYHAVWRDPVTAEHRGHQLYSMPPPSSGGVTLALILNILERFDPLPTLGSADLIHLETEAMRRAFIERNLYLADPDFVELPLERLQSQEYADLLAGQIDPERATPTDLDLFVPPESLQTTHYSIVDGEGNAAAITTTINGSFGSAVTVTGAGFLLNNEMDDFAAAPGKPNQYGLVESEVNAIAPGKRMLSSMTPTIVVGPDGELELVVGSPGGPTIITSVFQVVRAVLDHDRTLRDAVRLPRLHHQALPDVLFYEPGGLGEQVRDDLTSRGHELRERQDYSGDIAAIRRLANGELVGVSDPRRGGAPRGAERP
jgi:gamma-glutamyltranspeptidase/glutathione hydrolase